MTTYWNLFLTGIDFSSAVPKYIILSNAIEKEIDEERLKPEVRFPAQRKMALLLDLNRKTVGRAIDLLKTKEKVYGRKGAGCFVSTAGSLTRKRLRKRWYKAEDDIVFREETLSSFDKEFGFFDIDYINLYSANFPYYLKYDEDLVAGHLSEFIVDLFLSESFISTVPEAVFGFQEARAAINILLNVLYTKNATLILTDPGCERADDVAQKAGFRVLTIGVDKAGMRTDELEALCKIEAPSVVYVVPRVHNPSTVRLSNERRIHLMKLKKEYGFELIEFDDFIDITKGSYSPLAAEFVNSGIIYVRPISTFGRWFSGTLMMTGPAEIMKQCSLDSRSHGVFTDGVMIKSTVDFWNFEANVSFFKKARKKLKENKERIFKVLESNGLKQYIREGETNDLCFYFDSPWLAQRFSMAVFFNHKGQDKRIEELINQLKEPVGRIG